MYTSTERRKTRTQDEHDLNARIGVRHSSGKRRKMKKTGTPKNGEFRLIKVEPSVLYMPVKLRAEEKRFFFYPERMRTKWDTHTHTQKDAVFSTLLIYPRATHEVGPQVIFLFSFWSTILSFWPNRHLPIRARNVTFPSFGAVSIRENISSSFCLPFLL